MKLIEVFLVFLSLISLPTNTTATTTCPIDFSYITRLRFVFSACKNLQASSKVPTPCCQTLYLVFGVGLAQQLKKTSLFVFPNNETAATCFQGYQTILNSLSLPSDAVSYCFDPVSYLYVTTPNGCARIESTQDWVFKLNRTAELQAMDTACKPDLTNRTSCDSCVAASVKLHDRLNAIDGNEAHYLFCGYLVILYAAGASNELGPETNGTVSCLYGLTLNSTSNSNGTSIPTLPKKGSNGTSTVVLVIAIVSAVGGILLTVIVLYLIWKKALLRGQRNKENSQQQNKILSNDNAGNGENNTELPLFSLRSLLVATDNFSEANKLGEGGFGPVYKGILAKNQEVAIKRLSTRSGQGQNEFLNEVKLIAKLQHTNLVRLLGCCIEEEEMILVYEYMHNRSLDHILFDSSENKRLDWGKRSRIIDGIAQGVLYIHKYSRLKIIHRDLKASNVLLDEDMNAKISDFGMAKIFEKNQIEANTNRVVGTYGYMSPEYARYGHFSEKSDVYSFGVLLFEILSGKRNSAFYRFENPLTLLGWALKLWKEGSEMKVIDESVRETCPPHEAKRYIHVAFLCVQEDPVDRPTMATVINMLVNDTTSLPPFKEPAFSEDIKSSDVGSGSSSNILSINALTITMPLGR